MTLEQLDTEKVRLAIKMAVTARQDLKLDQVTLANLHLNGLPVFAAPLLTPMHLIKSQRVELQEPLLLTVYLRDLSSTSPLSQALQDGYASLDGELYLSVHLNLIGKLVLRSTEALVPMKLQQKVPLTIPGGALARKATIAVLETADAAVKHLHAGASSWMGLWPGLRRDALQQYAGATFAVAVTYAVKDVEGKQLPLSWSGVAFRISPTVIVLPDEALEPWSFDPEIAGGLQTGVYNLEPDAFKLSLWPAGQAVPGPIATDGGLQLGKQMKAHELSHQVTNQVVIPGHSPSLHKANVALRASDANIAILAPTEFVPDIHEAKIAPEPLPLAWEWLALLRFPRLSSGTLIPEVILTSGHLDHGRIRLAINVDSTVFGSPIIASSGVIGMVQDESTGIFWSEIAKKLKSSD
jgi:hypothetical protein